MHSTAGGAKPRLGVGAGGGEKEGGAQGCLSVEPCKHGTRSVSDDRHAAKWQNKERHLTLGAPLRADRKSHLNCSFKHPITQTAV